MTTKVLKNSNGTLIKINVLSSRAIFIGPIHDDFEVYDKDKILIGLECDNFRIKINDNLKIDKQKYKIQSIKKESCHAVFGPGYYLYTHEKITKTSTFLLPFLGHNRESFKWNTVFVNSFVGTEYDGDYGDSIYLLYRFDGSISFLEFEEELRNHKWFQSVIEVDNYHTMYKFELPKDNNDINKILEGRYSTITESAKERIIEFHGNQKPIKETLYKAESRRLAMERDLGARIPIGNELMSSFVPINEIYLYKYITK